jgi:hypothetical protein
MALQLDEHIGHRHQSCTRGRACQMHAAAIFVAAAIKVVQLHGHIGHCTHGCTQACAYQLHAAASIITAAPKAKAVHIRHTQQPASLLLQSRPCNCMHTSAIGITGAPQAVHARCTQQPCSAQLHQGSAVTHRSSASRLHPKPRPYISDARSNQHHYCCNQGRATWCTLVAVPRSCLLGTLPTWAVTAHDCESVSFDFRIWPRPFFENGPQRPLSCLPLLDVTLREHARGLLVDVSPIRRARIPLHIQ